MNELKYKKLATKFSSSKLIKTFQAHIAQRPVIIDGGIQKNSLNIDFIF